MTVHFIVGARRVDAHGVDQSREANVAATLIPTTYETRQLGQELRALAAVNYMPTVHAGSRPVDAGGLMSYGPPADWSWRTICSSAVRPVHTTCPR